jgi:hypothetical protein
LECDLRVRDPRLSFSGTTVMVFRAQDPARGRGRRRHAAARGRTRPGAGVVGTRVENLFLWPAVLPRRCQTSLVMLTKT